MIIEILLKNYGGRMKKILPKITRTIVNLIWLICIWKSPLFEHTIGSNIFENILQVIFKIFLTIVLIEMYTIKLRVNKLETIKEFLRTGAIYKNKVMDKES
jgi:hypothetical protein